MCIFFSTEHHFHLILPVHLETPWRSLFFGETITKIDQSHFDALLQYLCSVSILLLSSSFEVSDPRGSMQSAQIGTSIPNAWTMNDNADI